MDVGSSHTTPARLETRIEDDRLLRGLGSFVDDLQTAGQAAGFFVRAPHAFADVRAIDSEAARQHPGVLAVLTAADIAAEGVGSMSRPIPVVGRGGAMLKVPHRPALADGRVLHVGQPVALVVAESLDIAQQAAESVQVDYAVRQAVVGVEDAIAADAPQLWPEAPANVAVDWPGPVPDDGTNDREIERVLSGAKYVARISLVNQRLIVASMEPRGATADFDPLNAIYTLRCGSQGVYVLRNQIAAIMGLRPEEIRVVTDDVGGAFGMKTPVYPEYIALLVAARRLRRPIHWMSTRSEAFVSDNQARDTIAQGELALDEDGRFLALRVSVLANMGAFLSEASAFIATSNFGRCLSSIYHFPRIAVGVRCVFTNTLPTGPYRGAGRPEANYTVERLIEAAARLTGIDSVDLRRKNMLTPQMLPYATPVGTVYDSGEFAAILDRALALSDYAGFPLRRARAVSLGKCRGIGVSCFLEHSGGTPAESAAVTFPGERTLAIALGVQASGQGQATVFTRLAAERLGIPPDRIIVSQGDTRHGLSKVGTSTASRSTMMAGGAIARAIGAVIEKGRKLAARMLEAAEGDIDYRAGAFEVTGTDRRVSLFAVAAKAAELVNNGEAEASLDTEAVAEIPQTFPNGCHIAEVEIDPQTGAVTVVAYTAVDDCGTALNPMLVEGQLHGGVAQGLGQAFLEEAIYDRDSGQLVTGSFSDYAMPRADEMPNIGGALHAVPATTNALGVKGVGEAGTTGALAAIMNAIADALPGDAGATLDMPATPHKIWRACQQLHSSAERRTGRPAPPREGA
jgi:aerobic carbon-monoxide dehydrogenase large subunit